jgi:hypothetical protein
MSARRRLLAASPVITHGRQLVSQLAGVTTNVGPNALLGSGSYPLPGSASSGPLTLAPLPGGFTFWRINSSPGSGQFTLPNLWSAGATTPYAYSNDPANLGGIVPAGGMLIDGYPVAAGTYVFQFMDLSLGGFLLLAGGPSVLFRGCRLRAAASSPGFFNSQSGSYAGTLYLHYCDFGGPNSLSASSNAVAVQIGESGGFRALRCYISYTASGIIPASQNGILDVIECLIEKITLYSAGSGFHLNGVKLQGGDTNCLFLRNCVVFDEFDENGLQITQTDPIGMIPTFGSFLGTGTNSDGSPGYVIEGNFVGGGSYCMYLGGSGGGSPVANLTCAGNQWTTSAFVTGGANGASTFAPAWGSNGNSQSGNIWADGPSAGQSVM